MKNYHVCLKQSFQKHALNFKQAHYLDLPSGQVVVVGEMTITRYASLNQSKA